MIFYDQTTLSVPEKGTYGDCVRAVYKTILQNPLEGFPHSIGEDGQMNPAFFDALEALGWEENFVVYRPERDFTYLSRIVMAAGPTVRTHLTGAHHGVVYDRVAGAMLHDPHPSRAGLTEIRFLYWLEAVA